MTGTNVIIIVYTVVTVILSCMSPPIAIAEEAKATANQTDNIAGDRKADIDEEALKILKKATDYLTSLKQFRLKGNTVEDVVQESGQKLQFSSTIEVYEQRPNRMFASRIDDDGIVRRFWYDGKSATMYDEGQNVYGKIRAPDTIDAMLDYVEKIVESPRPLADLLYNDLSHLSDYPLSGKYVDVSFIEGIACDHLAFRGESVDWQIWVDRGEKPFIQKVVITYKELPGAPQFTARMVEWDIQPNISDDLFQFSAPEGARQIRVVVSERGNPAEGGAQ